MINPQEAEATPQKYKIDDGESRRLTAVARLPRHLRLIAWPLLGYNQRGRPFNIGDWQAISQAGWTAAQQLEALSAADRLRIFEAILPKIASQVEAGWQLQKQFPYGTGGQRRAFRAPHRPELTLPRRAGWLDGILTLTRDYEQDVIWLAQWAAYLTRGGWFGNHLGILFAATIETGDQVGEAVFEILVASAKGEHDIGAMGRHVTQGLLSASRPEGWTLIEQLLKAAQRQEGLRQVILETVDEAHPEAFRRMVRLIREQNLNRFSSVVRAMDVWLGLGWEAANARAVSHIIDQLDDLLAANEARRLTALESDVPQTVYLALCVLGFADAETTVPHAATLLSHPNLEHRFVATYFLAQLQLLEAEEALLPMVTDHDLRIATIAFAGLKPRYHGASSHPKLFERLEEALPHFPRKKKTLEPIVWPWLTLTADRQTVANALYDALDQRPLTRLFPYINLMDPSRRARLASDLQSQSKPGDAPTRDMLLQLMGDRSAHVRASAIEAAARLKLGEAEARQIEGYLTRKAGDLRRGLLGVLLNQKDKAVLDSSSRLLNAKHPMQRQAGLELLRQLIEQERAVNKCRALARDYVTPRKQISEAEQQLLDAILDRRPEVATLDDGLRLFEPEQCTPPLVPKAQTGLFKRSTFVSPAAVACLQSLDDLIHSHRETPVTLQRWDGEYEELLGNIQYAFPSPDPQRTLDEDINRLPLRELWQTWWTKRPARLRDQDGWELLRALAPLMATMHYFPFGHFRVPRWLKKAEVVLYGKVNVQKLRYPHIIRPSLWWLIRLHPPVQPVDFLLDAVEHSLSLIPPKKEAEQDRQQSNRLWGWLRLARQHRSLHPTAWQDSQHVRLWRLLRYADDPANIYGYNRLQLDEVMLAYRAGGATQADLLHHLIGPREIQQGYGSGGAFGDLGYLSGRKPDRRHSQFATDPELQALVAECRQRIVAVELQRGDIPTAASTPAMALRYSGGLNTLLQLLQAFGKEKFVRGWTYDGLSKQALFSHLIRSTLPADTDTPEQFAAQAKKARISQKRLVETAVYAPQWADHFEYTLGWPQFAEAVWWFHAHTKDNRWQIDQEIRELWQAQASERTPLTGQELIDGAVDVAWFRRVYAALGEKRWRQLDAAAKYASGGGGHKRAQLFADAMLGHVDQAELVRRIVDKRHQDVVRAIGLLPLPLEASREDVILERYQLIQEFVRGSRKFGSQRQASEKLAAKIGLENLARTAGFPDPLRLEWAMEAYAVADLASGPVTVMAGEVSVTLAIDEWGEPQLDVTKNDRALKSVPAKLKKQPDIATLLARKRDIKRQASRMRLSLEQAMCRGDSFTAGELQKLLTHPVLKPMLEQLVFIGQAVVGYPVAGEQALERVDGRSDPVSPDTSLRIAHPHDLLLTGEWHLWQQECFRHERIQPFKQIFRELYVLTAAEKAAGTISRRYAGHQVNPRQALALLGQRAWISHPEEGIRRTFHDEGIAAWLSFVEGYYTPAEVEGLTLEEVHFSQRGEWQSLPLDQIPPRLFSEVMRDLDLVVSVAHQGGVDPETTASTIEMRAALIRETCGMLKIDNVRLQGNHALIDGALNNYSVHLGSGVVHQQPGGYVCIVPVHAQQRGRIFLPFVDDDPKTAEVMAKVLLLARDKEIKDPTILEQILPTN